MVVDLPDFLFFSCGKYMDKLGKPGFQDCKSWTSRCISLCLGCYTAFLKLPLSFCFGLCRSLDVWNESRKVREGLECLHVAL